MEMHRHSFKRSSVLIAVVIATILISVPLPLLGQSTNVSTQSATISLSPAQLSALHGSPVQLVPAPGTAQVIVPLGAMVVYRPGSAAYAVDNGSHLSIYEGATSNSIGQISAVSLTGQPGPQAYMALGLNGVGAAQATLENAPLLVQNDSETEWSSGNGTVTITVYYIVAPLQ
jgi:hypothetical protein